MGSSLQEWDYEVATTATPGSAWEDEPKLDYWNLPTDETLGGMDQDDDTVPNVLDEIERAKRNSKFEDFLVWYFKRYEGEISDDYTWGAADGDPLEDLKDFLVWLVETKQGQWKDYSPETDVNILGQDPLWLGTIPYSKNWEKVLESMMVGYDTDDCFVDAKGWIIDFASPGKLKHVPAKSQFPLEVRLALHDLKSETKDNTKESQDATQECDTSDSCGASFGLDHSYANHGWDLKDEYEEWVSEEPTVDTLVEELEDAMKAPLDSP